MSYVPLACQQRPIESYVARSFDDPHVSRDTVTNGKTNDVANDNTGGWDCLSLSVTDDGCVFRNERLDGAHNPRGMPVNPGVERSGDDDDK